MHVIFTKHLVISRLENLRFGNENVTCNNGLCFDADYRHTKQFPCQVILWMVGSTGPDVVSNSTFPCSIPEEAACTFTMKLQFLSTKREGGRKG